MEQMPRVSTADPDSAEAAGSNIPPDIALEAKSTGFVEDLAGLQTEVAADDLLHKLGGAAENRLEADEPPGPDLAPERIGPGLRRLRPGCI